MPAHRTLDFAKFVTAISPEVLENYLRHFNWEGPTDVWASLNAERLREFLDRPENAAFTATIEAEFRRVNDLCARGMNLVPAAYREFDVVMPERRSAEELAMLLFLNHEEAFAYAWSRYLLFAGTPKLSFFPIGRQNLRISKAKLDRLEADLRAWFGRDAKGTCIVKSFRDSHGTFVLISRGSYMRTVAHWEGSDIGFTKFRPATEDVLAFDHKTGVLTIKAGLAKDRSRYLAGDRGLADRAATQQVYTLKPLQDRTFDYAGNDEITSIDLVKARLRLAGVEHPEIQIKSDDVRRTVDAYLKVALDAGTLTSASFRFHIQPPAGRRTKVTFEIEPPLRTDLAEKRYADIIERYLLEQGIKRV